MKNSVLTSRFAIILGCYLSLCFTTWAADAIPHYEIYPPTPHVDYEEKTLDFYSVKNPFGEFSNFALFPIVLDKLVWPTSEHYYQAHKYSDPILIERVRSATTPYEAALLGRDPKLPKRDDWNEIKDEVMGRAVAAKFEQYIVLQKLLLHTKESLIYEHTKLDCYWGDCGDRSGKNKLGLMLMKIRQESKGNDTSL